MTSVSSEGNLSKILILFSASYHGGGLMNYLSILLFVSYVLFSPLLLALVSCADAVKGHLALYSGR